MHDEVKCCTRYIQGKITVCPYITCPCREIEAKTRAALVDIDINEIVDDNVQQGWEADDDEAGFDGLEADNDVDEDLLASGAAMDGSSDTVLP